MAASIRNIVAVACLVVAFGLATAHEVLGNSIANRHSDPETAFTGFSDVEPDKQGPSLLPGDGKDAPQFIAVSEPGTLALFAFGLGLLALGHFGRRRRDRGETQPTPSKRGDGAAKPGKPTLRTPALQR